MHQGREETTEISPDLSEVKGFNYNLIVKKSARGRLINLHDIAHLTAPRPTEYMELSHFNARKQNLLYWNEYFYPAAIYLIVDDAGE